MSKHISPQFRMQAGERIEIHAGGNGNFNVRRWEPGVRRWWRKKAQEITITPAHVYVLNNELEPGPDHGSLYDDLVKLQP